MEKGYRQPPISLPQRAYLITDSLSQGTKMIVTFLLILTAFFLVLTTWIVLGLEVVYLFVLTIIFLIIYGPLVVWYLSKMRNLQSQWIEWKGDYNSDMYSLIFNTTVPKGNTTGEKVLSLASMVFPEMRDDYIRFSLEPLAHIKYYLAKLRKSKELTRRTNYKAKPDYNLDVVFGTLAGYFIIKEFKDNVVTVEDLRYLIDVLNNNFKAKFRRGTGILSTICVAKEYDKHFLNRESLEKIMTEEIKADFFIDLVVEEDVGYSVLWVD